MPHVFAPKIIPQKYFYVLAPGMCKYRHYTNTEGRGQSTNTYFKNNSSNIFSCIRTHANTGPTCIRAKINSSSIFSCMYRFCAGGYTGTNPPLFSKKAMPWGKKWPVQMNFAFFRCKSICTGGGPESGRKNSKKCLLAGTGTKIYFSRDAVENRRPLLRFCFALVLKGFETL